VEWAPFELALLLAVVFVGTVVQGTLGFGLALLVVPVAAVVAPEALPAAVIVLVLPLSFWLAFRERRSVDLSGLLYLIGGRLVGTALGVALLVAVPIAYLSVLFGGLVVVAAVASAVSGPGLAVNRATQSVGGVASGIMGTAAGIGGPPLALVYQSRPGAEIRGTLAVVFAVGGAISLLALVPAGRVTGGHVTLALVLLPALVLGLLVAARLTKVVARTPWLRPAVLLFAALSGLAAAAQALL
jgi:uncharacterized membrane protein YfcA